MAFKFDSKNRRGGIGELFAGMIRLIWGDAGDPAAYLGAAATLNSGWVNVEAFARIVGSAFASHTGTLKIQFSTTGSGDEVDSEATAITVPAGAQGVAFNVPVQAQYVRLNYVNGGTEQTAFRIAAYGQAVS